DTRSSSCQHQPSQKPPDENLPQQISQAGRTGHAPDGSRLHHLSEGRSSAPARFSPTPPPPPAAALEASRPRQDRARGARSACSLRVCLLLLAARAVSRVHPVDSASSSRSASRSAARSASGARNVAACRSRERGPTSVFPVPPYPLPAGELEASAARLR